MDALATARLAGWQRWQTHTGLCGTPCSLPSLSTASDRPHDMSASIHALPEVVLGGDILALCRGEG